MGVGALVGVAAGDGVGTGVGVGGGTAVGVGVGIAVAVGTGTGVDTGDGAAGIHISAEFKLLLGPIVPPVTKTCPLDKTVAVCPNLASLMVSIDVNVSVAGSYISAVSRANPPQWYQAYIPPL